VAALLLVVAFSGLFAFGMAKAGIYAAVRQATREHNHRIDLHGEDGVCLKCLREGLRGAAIRGKVSE
jgi:hypothetical protein